jgi:hypothetical protein
VRSVKNRNLRFDFTEDGLGAQSRVRVTMRDADAPVYGDTHLIGRQQAPLWVETSVVSQRHIPPASLNLNLHHKHAPTTNQESMAFVVTGGRRIVHPVATPRPHPIMPKTIVSNKLFRSSWVSVVNDKDAPVPRWAVPMPPLEDIPAAPVKPEPSKFTVCMQAKRFIRVMQWGPWKFMITASWYGRDMEELALTSSQLDPVFDVSLVLSGTHEHVYAHGRSPDWIAHSTALKIMSILGSTLVSQKDSAP